MTKPAALTPIEFGALVVGVLCFVIALGYVDQAVWMSHDYRVARQIYRDIDTQGFSAPAVDFLKRKAKRIEDRWLFSYRIRRNSEYEARKSEMLFMSYVAAFAGLASIPVFATASALMNQKPRETS